MRGLNPPHLAESSCTDEQKSENVDLSWISCQGKGEGVRGPSTDEGPQLMPLKKGLANCSEKGVLNMKRGQPGKLQNKS